MGPRLARAARRAGPARRRRAATSSRSGPARGARAAVRARGPAVRPGARRPRARPPARRRLVARRRPAGQPRAGGVQRAVSSSSVAGGPGSGSSPGARRPSSASASERRRSCRVRSSSPRRTEATCSKTSARSLTSASGRIAPARWAASKSSTLSRPPPRRGRREVGRRHERAGQALGQRAGVGLDRGAHKGREALPGVLCGRPRGLRRRDVPPQAVRAQRAQQVLLARVARVQRAHPDAGVAGDGRDRGRRVGHEDRPGGDEDALVVARAARAPGLRHGSIVAGMEHSVLIG